MFGTEGNLQSLTGGLRLKVRIQHPDVHERTDRGGSYWFFRYWEDVLQPDGTTKVMRRFQGVGPSKLEPINSARLEIRRSVVKVSGYFLCDFSFACGHSFTPLADSDSASARTAREQWVLTLPSEQPIAAAVSATSSSSQ